MNALRYRDLNPPEVGVWVQNTAGRVGQVAELIERPGRPTIVRVRFLNTWGETHGSYQAHELLECAGESGGDE